MDRNIPSIICVCDNESKARFESKNSPVDAEHYDYCSKRTYLTTPNNLIESVIHMLMCGLGGGLVALHAADMECGLFAAMAMNVFLSAAVGYCVCILVWSAQKLYGRVQINELTYPDVMEAAVLLSPWPTFQKAARGFRNQKSNKMKLFTCIVLFLFTQNSVKSEKPFKSIPVTVKTYENDTVLLPCYIDENEGKLRVRWYKDKKLLGDSHTPHEILPPRVRMHANYSLQVDVLQAEDTADYTCEIIRPEPWGPIRQTHSIEVLYSPTIKTVPEEGFLEVRKGEYVDIGCETTGTPAPIVDWRKNGEPMALLEHRSRIRFRAEHRLLAGEYECIANNGVGDPARATITVVIQDAPVVTSSRTYVHTAVGLRAALAATVEFAAPEARTNWYRDGRLVKTDDRIVQIGDEKVHQLIFRNVRKSDLGNYTFRAENKLGMADLMFKLTGVPNAASFKVEAALNKATATSFTLIWEVDSYSTIIEYNLWLRPYYGRLVSPEPDAFTTEPPANQWSKIVVPGDSSDGPIHSAIYTVRGLTPSTVYEAIVTSRNRFGWSKPSSVLHFATEPGAGRTRPSTADYSDITPILLETEPEPYNISQAQIFERLNEMSSGARETMSMTAILISCSVVFSFS